MRVLGTHAREITPVLRNTISPTVTHMKLRTGGYANYPSSVTQLRIIPIPGAGDDGDDPVLITGCRDRRIPLQT